MKSIVFLAGLFLLFGSFECGERYVPDLSDPDNPFDYEILIAGHDYFDDANRRANLRYKGTSGNIDIVLTFIGEANFHPNSVSWAGGEMTLPTYAKQNKQCSIEGSASIVRGLSSANLSGKTTCGSGSKQNPKCV